MWAIKRVSALALSALLLLLTGCSSGAQAEDNFAAAELINDKVTTYNTTAAELKDLVKQVSLPVESVYAERRRITSGKELLVFKQFEVVRGVEFKQGDLLATLSGTGSEADVMQLALELDYTRASFEETCEAMTLGIEAAENAPADDAYTQRINELNVDKQQAYYDRYVLTTRASLAAMKLRLETARAALEETYIYAPCDGKVMSLALINQGTVIDPDTLLMTIYTAQSLVLYSNSTSGALVYNMDVDVTYEDDDEEIILHGRVVSSSELLPGYMTSGIYIKLETPIEINSRHDVTASCEYTLLKNVVIVPRTGVFPESGRYFLTLLEGNTTRKRYIIRGPQQNNEIVAFQGVYADELVVTNQYTS